MENNPDTPKNYSIFKVGDKTWTIGRVYYGSRDDFGLWLTDDDKSAHDHIWSTDAFELAPAETAAPRP